MKKAFAWAVATACGAGLSPWAPGTAGSLVGIPLAWLSAEWPTEMRAALWAGLLFAGTWAAKTLDETLRTHDNQKIVIDEVVGLGLTAWTAGRSPWALLAAFVAFRFFDILKPPPIRNLDRWSKKATGWAGGFAVMADDLAAAVLGMCCVIALQKLALPR